MFRAPGGAIGLVLAAILSAGIATSRPHDHGGGTTPVQSCAVCHAAHQPPSSTAAAPDLPQAPPPLRTSIVRERAEAPASAPAPTVRARAPPA